MRNTLLSILIISSFLCFSQRQKQEKKLQIYRVNFNLNFGTAYNIPTYLKIQQEGHDPIELWARYATKGFKVPIYWDYKLEFETEKNLIGLRSTHHKLYLTNPTPEINTFSITHGYNLVMAYYGWKKKYFDLLVGGGIAFSHPEGVVHGEFIALEEGIPLYGGKYRLTAPNFEFEIKRKWYFTNRMFFNYGLRFLAGYAKPKIIDGYIETYPIGIHIAAGMGIDFYKIKNVTLTKSNNRKLGPKP
tara:strand:+ start:135 stop:869 length:735 start_codon:yes stop_codon:yes gene_type:complete